MVIFTTPHPLQQAVAERAETDVYGAGYSMQCTHAANTCSVGMQHSREGVGRRKN